MTRYSKKNRTLIIAEIGVNHNGKIELAKKLINLASKAGADIVKLQSYITEELVTVNSRLAEYQTKKVKIKNQFQLLKKYELNEKQIKSLKNFAKKKKIEFLLSPFDLKSINFIKKLNCKRIKIPSGEINNLPYLEKIGELKKDVILSSGMSSIKDIGNAIKILLKKGTKKKQITVLHCNTSYPTPSKDINLKAMKSIRDKFNVKVGYSDHSNNSETPIIAVSLGASVFEKHLTIDRKMKGPDHSSSFDFKQFSRLVKNIRNTEIILGSNNKIISESEKKNVNLVRKSIVASQMISKNEKFTKRNITTKRPGNGISPMRFKKILGKKAKKSFLKDEIIFV